MVFAENFTGIGIQFRFHNSDVEKYMYPYISKCGNDDCDIFASREHIESMRPYYQECTEDAYVEYKSLIELTSRFLLPYRQCLFHAVALCWQEKAWLFTGPSGTGKTTQYKKWKVKYRDKVQMICGDMPLLEWRVNDTIWVHPSPWNGKERMKGKVSAPLGGIVLLEQANENSVRRMKPIESGVPLFLQMAVRPESEEQISQMSELVNNMIEHYPVWKLKNCGDDESVEVMSDAFSKLLE